MLIAREPRIFATQNPFRASTSAMPHVKTTPSSVAKSQPASAASGLELAPSLLAAAGVVLVTGAYLLASRTARSTYGDADSPYGTAEKQR